MHGYEDKKRQILDRVDIVDLVSEHVALKRSGQRFVALCPFHTEKTPSFTLRPEHGTFKCFGCGKGGDIFSFVQARENVSFMEALRMLADRAGVELERQAPGDVPEHGRADVAKANAWAMKFFRHQLQHDPAGQAARDYVRSRNISPDIAERFGLGLAIRGATTLEKAASRAGMDIGLLIAADLVRRGERGDVYETFRDRLMFPIRDATTRVIGFGGRTLIDDRAKYLNTRQNALFDKGRNVYGIDTARDAAKRVGRFIVVEGYTDCLAAHQAGFSETVATLGTALTESQVDLLRRYCDELILLFDSDDAGATAADRAIHVALPRCVKVRLARVPDGKDPCEFLDRAGPDKFSDVLNNASDALEFKWLETQRRFQTEGSDTRRGDAVRDFLRLVSEGVDGRAVDAIQRGLLVNQVAHLLRMERSEVDNLLRRLKPRRVQGEVSKAAPDHARIPLDAEQASWVHALEVLLNEPDILIAGGSLPDIARIADEQDRRIAGAIGGLADAGERFSFADVRARLTDPTDVERAEMLAERGAERGNFTGTFRLAIERIESAQRIEDVERKRQGLGEALHDDGALDQTKDDLTTLSNGVREHRSFAPRRLIRRATQ